MNDTSLKAKIRNISKSKNISAQAVLQNYLMSRFLYRLSLTDYKDRFVIKGGMLISSIIGIDHRSTMDLDTTLRDISLSESIIRKSFEEICNVKIDDNIIFTFNSINPIRDDDEYGGYRVTFYGSFGKIKAPMSMDVSTGDVITPGAEKHSFKDILNEENRFELWSYPIETILAEKVETILSRGIDNTRPRDFYDVYMLSGIDFDRDSFRKAFKATAEHRKSYEKISGYRSIISEINQSKEMNRRWDQYIHQMPYVKDLSFSETLNVIDELLRG